MSALHLAEIELQSASELVECLQSAGSWREIEALTSAYPQWKEEAWELLSPEDQERIKALKKWKDNPIAQKFPPGCLVQRFKDGEGQVGKVIKYWRAYGIDYVTFLVGADIDWCRANYLKKVNPLKSKL